MQNESANQAQQPASRKKSGKKSKKKKGKLSLQERRLLKLEKKVESMKSNYLQYEHFLQTADVWLTQNGYLVELLLVAVDEEKRGTVSYKLFKSGRLSALVSQGFALFDRDCLLNEVETHLLCKLLDHENSGEISYTNLSKGLRWNIKRTLLKEEELTDLRDENVDSNFNLVKSQNAKSIAKCPCCKIGLWTPSLPDVKYVDLTVLLITFADTFKKHPCHFNKIVHTHVTIFGLTQLIKSETGIQSTTIAVFRDKSRSIASQLQNHLTLEECGYDGRDWFNPIEHVIYYDFVSEFNDCPILMCDHYFHDALKI